MALYCLVAGVLFTVGALLALAKLDPASSSSEFGEFAIFAPIFGLCGGVGLYIIFKGWLQHTYDKVAALLRDTTLPEMILDQGFRDRVLDVLNKDSVIKTPQPKSVEQEIRFAARYWRMFEKLVGQRARRDASFWLWLDDALAPDGEDFVKLARCRAICDFFLEQG
ncbi:MAG: hypothetical protein M3R04_02870 [bacterium]|nr:hypothetical protein [bacterium]